MSLNTLTLKIVYSLHGYFDFKKKINFIFLFIKKDLTRFTLYTKAYLSEFQIVSY